MSTTKQRPLSVTIISAIYILTGVLGLGYHLKLAGSHHLFDNDVVLITVTEIVAVVAGVFMLRGANWARWLALAWMAFHVAISVLNGWSKVAVHAAFLLIIGYFLLRRQVNEYFATKSSSQP